MAAFIPDGIVAACFVVVVGNAVIPDVADLSQAAYFALVSKRLYNPMYSKNYNNLKKCGCKKRLLSGQE